MPSLDETITTVWNVQRPPIALLATAGAVRAATAALSEEERAPYHAFTEAALAWYPRMARPLKDLFEKEFTVCLDRYGEHPDEARVQPALDAAYHLLVALRGLAPGALTLSEIGMADGLGEETFIKLVRKLAKLNSTDLETWKVRFEYLLSFRELTGKDAAWPELVHRTVRMGFERPTRGAKLLPKSLQELGRLSDLGAVSSWSQMGPKHALTLQLGTTKRTAVLDDEQRQEVLDALPWLT